MCYFDLCVVISMIDCFVDFVVDGIDCVVWVGVLFDMLFVVWCVGEMV